MRLLVGLFAVLGFTACGVPTGSSCPPDSTLRYDNFGKEFMSSYCTRCHSSELKGGARNGAPDGRNYDTLDGIKADIGEIDEEAAAGPRAVNTGMPKGSPSPSEEERRKLGEWLACGAPQ